MVINVALINEYICQVGKFYVLETRVVWKKKRRERKREELLKYKVFSKYYDGEKLVINFVGTVAWYMFIQVSIVSS